MTERLDDVGMHLLSYLGVEEVSFDVRRNAYSVRMSQSARNSPGAVEKIADAIVADVDGMEDEHVRILSKGRLSVKHRPGATVA